MKRELTIRQMDVSEIGKWLKISDNMMFRIVNIYNHGDHYVGVNYRFAGLFGDSLIFVKNLNEDRFIVFVDDNSFEERAIKNFKDEALAYCDDFGLSDDTIIENDFMAIYIAAKIRKYNESSKEIHNITESVNRE